MKTLVGSLLALGLFSSAASAQYCPPGWGYGQSHYGQHRPTAGTLEKRVVEMPATEAPATETPSTEAPASQPEPPQAQEQAPAPESAPQK